MTTRVFEVLMFGQRSRPMASSPPPTSDPNEMLQRIDQTTTMMFHWLRAGVVIAIVLLIAILLGF